MPYAKNKSTDQPVHPRSLIRTSVFRCLDSVIPTLAKSQISRLKLVSVAVQASFNSHLVVNPKDRFSGEEAHIWVGSQELKSSLCRQERPVRLCISAG